MAQQITYTCDLCGLRAETAVSHKALPTRFVTDREYGASMPAYCDLFAVDICTACYKRYIHQLPLTAQVIDGKECVKWTR